MGAATTYTLSGPTTGRAGDDLTFTVSIGTDTSGDVVITPAASVASSGTFAPATVTLSTAHPTAAFVFKPVKLAAVNTISTTNGGSLANPAGVALSVTADLTLTGPAALSPGVPASYSVELGAGTFSGNVVVTPAGPAGWTFTPSTVTLTNATRKKTFAVQADEPESGTLVVTADQAFAVPGAGIAVSAAYAATSFNTTLRNASGVRMSFSFLGTTGVTLDPDETYSTFGDVATVLSARGFPDERAFADFEHAILNGNLEILTTPAVIVTDAATGSVKTLTLLNGALGVGDPSFGPRIVP